MSKINIAGLNDIIDINYRYKMTKIDTIIEKNKTVIQNLSKISGELGRDEQMIIHFFKKHFGTNFTMKNSKYTSAKKLTNKELQDALKEFIEHSVLCPTCKLPETHLKPSKTSITITCDCCGHADKLNIAATTKTMKDVFEHMMKN